MDTINLIGQVGIMIMLAILAGFLLGGLIIWCFHEWKTGNKSMGIFVMLLALGSIFIVMAKL